MPSLFFNSKKILRWLLVLCVINAPLTGFTQTINAVEYFFDTDPGFGQATSITVNAADNIIDISNIVSIAHLSYGFHTFYIRSRSNSGRWSLTNRFSFIKMKGDFPLREVEYFYDIDPGFGKGTPLAINPNNTLADFVAQVNITNLTAGAHRLFIRSKEGTDNWSLTNYMDFVITTSDAAPFINVNSLTNYSPCAGSSFKMAYHKTGTYALGNQFKVQLSDGNGSFANPVEIGSVTDTTDQIITCHLPKLLHFGENYRIRTVSTNPVVTGIANALPVTIRPAPYLGNDTTAFILCSQHKTDISNIYNLTGLTAQWMPSNPTMAGLGAHQLIATNNFGCNDTALVTVKQDVAIWNGNHSNDWHNALNWSTGRIPNEVTHAIITGTTPNPCIIINNHAIAASIQVINGAIHQTINERALTITGNCTPLPAAGN